MQSYYQRTRDLFRQLPGDIIRRYILDTPTGETFLEMVALRIMMQDEEQGKNAARGYGSIHFAGEALPRT